MVHGGVSVTGHRVALCVRQQRPTTVAAMFTIDGCQSVQREISGSVSG